jgi:hypothetical protein
MNHHECLEWDKVRATLEANAEKLWSLNEMDRTGGEPDVVGHDKRRTNTFFMIVQREVLKASEVLATTVKRPPVLYAPCLAVHICVGLLRCFCKLTVFDARLYIRVRRVDQPA